MGFAKQNFSIEFLRDAWLPSHSAKSQAHGEEAKLTSAQLCGLQLLETISCPSVFAINRCKYLCVTFFVLRSDSDFFWLFNKQMEKMSEDVSDIPL